MQWYCDYSLGHILGVASVSLSLNHSIEPVVLIGSVVNSENSTVGFMERVRPLDYIPIPRLLLFLDITSVVVLYSIFESVLSRSLNRPINNNSTGNGWYLHGSQQLYGQIVPRPEQRESIECEEPLEG
jgi:hypothetical protein